MRKEKIVIVKKPDELHFYLVTDEIGKVFLFMQKFTKGVYDYFRKGRSIGELHTFKKWGRNPRLDKTIGKIPMYIKYVYQEKRAICIGKNLKTPRILPRAKRRSSTQYAA